MNAPFGMAENTASVQDGYDGGRRGVEGYDKPVGSERTRSGWLVALIEGHHSVETIDDRRDSVLLEQKLRRYCCRFSRRGMTGSVVRTCSRVDGGGDPLSHEDGMLDCVRVYPQVDEGAIEDVLLRLDPMKSDMRRRERKTDILTKASKLSSTSPSHGYFACAFAPLSTSIPSPKSRRGLLVLRSL